MAAPAGAAAPPPLRVAVLGPGRVGSLFAFKLAASGAEVTLIGRPGSARLALLREAGGVASLAAGSLRVVPVASVVDSLDVSIAYDQLLVTVYTHQLDALVPTLRASAAKHVVVMCNTFQPLELQRAIGEGRTAFALPLYGVLLDADGRLGSTALSRRLERAMVSDAGVAAAWEGAGLWCDVNPAMAGTWLRSHAAAVVGLLCAAHTVAARRGPAARGGGAPQRLSWAEAALHGRATAEAFAVVRALGTAVTPAPVALLGRLPAAGWGALLYAISRTELFCHLGAAGGEAAALVDAVVAAADALGPGTVGTAALRAVRPAW